MYYEGDTKRLMKLARTELAGLSEALFGGRGSISEGIDEDLLENVTIDFTEPNVILSVKMNGHDYNVGICVIDDMYFNYFLEKRSVHSDQFKIYFGVYLASDLLSFYIYRSIRQLIKMKV